LTIPAKAGGHRVTPRAATYAAIAASSRSRSSAQGGIGNFTVHARANQQKKRV